MSTFFARFRKKSLTILVHNFAESTFAVNIHPETHASKSTQSTHLIAAEWDSVLTSYRPLLVHLAKSILHDQDDAQDAVQETMFKAYRSLEHLDPAANPRPWLCRICLNCCTDVLRRRGVEKSHEVVVKTYIDRKMTFQCEATNEPLIEMNLISAMNQIPIRNREILIQHHCEGKSITELSIEHQVPYGTIKCWLNRSRRQLLKCLQMQDT